MQSDRIIRHLVESRGTSYNEVSRRCGKSREWARQTAGKNPQLSTLASVADALGYAVQIVDKSTGAVFATVEPPERG